MKREKMIMEIVENNDKYKYILKHWIVFLCALIGYSNLGHPVLYTDSPPAPPSERHQTRLNCEQNGFLVCCRNKQRNFTNDNDNNAVTTIKP